MKPTSLIFSALLLSALCALVFSEHSFGPEKCCFNYVQLKHENSIISYKKTHPGCSQDGLIVKNRRGMELCINPSDEQAQRIMKRLDTESQKPKNN
ncbi:hypothetical protein MATL_G00204200 [Megalops atlanticus]|uniref:Chemokine interleukin-8-like domain-containing protein n=1 Tax=Megalops atlanticus TaxID=7932 RepID=A0A9D3SYL0_MEGAT|nr:hypothetical protein MATL_G00204200 [Megalops atlanticus]